MRQLNISQEERKKLLLDDDNEFEDQAIYDKIDQIRAEINSQKEDDQHSKQQNDPVDSAVTFNEKGEVSGDPIRRDTKDEDEMVREEGSRPSDVVNFDDKSNDAANKSNIDDENPLTDEHVSKTPDDLPFINAPDAKYYQNEEFYENDHDQENEEDEIDVESNEIENKLKMIQEKLDQITEDKRKSQTKREESKSSISKLSNHFSQNSKSKEQTVDAEIQKASSLNESKRRAHKQWKKVNTTF
jgi:hypothetical protein